MSDTDAMDKPYEFHGSLVAFEGNPDTVFTQLQLLPSSSQFMALPNVQSYLKDEDISSKAFNSRSYIRQIHEATQLRHKAATDFLQQATPDSKRLVFLHGGAASAVVECITAISEHETQGDISRAESLFRDVTSNGLGPLLKDEILSAKNTVTPAQDEESKVEDEVTQDSTLLEDPTIAAMKAADALDRETANLQPVNDLDFSVLSRPRSMSVPAYGYTNGFSRQSAISILGATQAIVSAEQPPYLGASDIEETENVHIGNDEGADCNPQSPRHSIQLGGLFPPPAKRANRAAETYEMATPDSIHVPSLGSPMSDASMSPPATPTGVIYGEARVIKMRVSRTEGDLTRTRSLDDLSMYGKLPRSTDALKPKALPTARELGGNSRPFSSIGVENFKGSFRPQSSLFAATEGTVLRASKTLVRRSPTVLNRIRQLARSNYVDRGTDAEYPCIEVSEKPDDVEEEQLIPVFPLLEDLVVHFTDDGPKGLIDQVVQAYKDGTYPMSRLFSPSAEIKEGETPQKPTVTSDPSLLFPAPSIQVTHAVDEQVSASSDPHEYDPYASHGNYGIVTPKPSQKRISVSSQTEESQGQATLSHNLPQTPPEPESKFHQFSIAGRGTVVSIQDALRSVLAVYFPCKEQGYHRYAFLLSSEMDNLWQPTFSQPAAPAASAPRRGQEPRRGCNRTDLILALGAQKGVKREFVWKVGEELQALGTRPDGYTRSVRLELKYLLWRVMEDFTRQPLMHQTANNPFNSAPILAAWLIPKLEMWLHAHMEFRFILLQYDEEHLGTVLALRAAISENMFKIAGIIDTGDSIPPAPHSPRPNRSGSSSQSLDGTPAHTVMEPSCCRPPSFSRVNYLLTCSATEAEHAIFVYSIWKHLIRGSQYYIPLQPPLPRSSSQNPIRASSPPPPLPSQASNIIAQYAASYSSSSYSASVRSSLPAASPPVSPSVPYYPGTMTPVSQNPVTGEPEMNQPRSAAMTLAATQSGSQPELPMLILPQQLLRQQRARSTSTAPQYVQQQRPSSPTASVTSRVSAAETVRTSRTGRTLHSIAKGSSSGGRRAGGGGGVVGREDVQSILTVDLEDDGEFASEERRLMPMFDEAEAGGTGKTVRPKPSSKKALKMLGLA